MIKSLKWVYVTSLVYTIALIWFFQQQESTVRTVLSFIAMPTMTLAIIGTPFALVTIIIKFYEHMKEKLKEKKYLKTFE